ncbi:MAG: hypothetical protein J6R91_06435 [Bacteroidaceae bacterium]|nr:hypothetical protein [Bacteroidaceae bacterium]
MEGKKNAKIEKHIDLIVAEGNIFNSSLHAGINEIKKECDILLSQCEFYRSLSEERGTVLELKIAECSKLKNEIALLKSALEENRILTTQLQDMELKLAQSEDFKSKCDQLQKQVAVLNQENTDLKDRLAQQKPAEPTTNKPDAQRLIECIVEFGENYPSNQNDKADVIRTLLAEDVFKEAGLSKEIKKRIKKIGRKEPQTNMTVTAQSMFDINGNNSVNIGNHEQKHDHE